MKPQVLTPRLGARSACKWAAACPCPPVFVERYLEIEIDVQVSNPLLDVVDAGADAGIRYGGTVPEEHGRATAVRRHTMGRGRRSCLPGSAWRPLAPERPPKTPLPPHSPRQ